MTNYLVNNCPNTVKHQASATQDKARTANKLLTSSADSRNRAASGKPTFSSNMPMDPGMAMARRRFSIFFKLLFLGKTANPNPNPEVQFLHNATLSNTLGDYVAFLPGPQMTAISP